MRTTASRHTVIWVVMFMALMLILTLQRAASGDELSRASLALAAALSTMARYSLDETPAAPVAFQCHRDTTPVGLGQCAFRPVESVSRFGRWYPYPTNTPEWQGIRSWSGYVDDFKNAHWW